LLIGCEAVDNATVILTVRERLVQSGWDDTTMGFLNYFTLLIRKGMGLIAGWFYGVVERLLCERLLLRYFYYAIDFGKHFFRAPATKVFLNPYLPIGSKRNTP
jgi:hypothetical protein